MEMIFGIVQYKLIKQRFEHEKFTNYCTLNLGNIQRTVIDEDTLNATETSLQ